MFFKSNIPNIHIKILAIIIAIIANFILGFLWYITFFGKLWGREMAFDNTK